MGRQLVIMIAAVAVGTLARYGLADRVQHWVGGSFPWGTAAVNITGCLLAGLLWALAEDRMPISAATRAAVFIGFLGAFTTFSTLMLETGGLLRDDRWWAAGANLLGQNTAGFLALWAGVALGKAW